MHIHTCSTSEKRTMSPPHSPQAGRGDGGARRDPASDNTASASERASNFCRITLAPDPPPTLAADMTHFHRALHMWNGAHNRTSIWDDLTQDEQRQVRELTARLESEAHPCRKEP